MISPRAKLSLVLAFSLGIIAWLPAALAWFAAEDLTQLYNVRDNPFGIWSGGDGPGFFRPLLSVLLWAGQSLWGANPLPFHLINIGIHLMNSALVCVITGQWLRLLHKESDQPVAPHLPLTGGVLFWLWPAHAEPVGWILGLTDIAATLPALASLAAYLRGWQRQSTAWLIAALVLYAVALGCKESIAALPAIIILFHASQLIAHVPGRGLHRAALSILSYGFIALAYLQVRYLATGAYIGGYGTSVHTRLPDGWLTQTLPRSLSHVFIPLPGMPAAALASALAITGATIALLLRRAVRKNPSLRTPALLMPVLMIAALAAFLPGITLPVGVIMEGQRFAYFPSVFGVMALSLALGIALPTPRAATASLWALSVGSAAALLYYNIPRYHAGKIAHGIVHGMNNLPPARTLYVLTAPGTYRDAFIMPHGFLQAARMLHPDLAVADAPNISNIVLWHPGLAVSVEREPPNRFRVKLSAPAAPGPKPWIMVYPDPARQAYSVRKDGEDMVVELHQYDPAQDTIAYVDGDKWVVVEPAK